MLYMTNCNTDTSQTFILEDGLYFNGKQFVPFKEIVIKSDTIFSINDKKSHINAIRINLAGKYLLPGFTDAHVHLMGNPDSLLQPLSPEYNTNKALRYGVTTLVDLFFAEDKIISFKQLTKDSPQYYSTLLLSGPMLTAPGGHGTEYGVPTRTIKSATEVTEIVTEVITNGADVIKAVYQVHSSRHSISKETLIEIIRNAHAHHKKVFVHVNMAAEATDCAEAGADVLAHMPVDSFSREELIKIKQSGIVIVPTISVIEHYYDRHSNIQTYYHQNLQQCISMNIPILAGTDAGNYGIYYGSSLHSELQYYIAAGMSKAMAIRTATENIGLVFPQLKRGKIKPGYIADIIVLNTNPMQDIRNTTDINRVFHMGKEAKY